MYEQLIAEARELIRYWKHMQGTCAGVTFDSFETWTTRLCDALESMTKATSGIPLDRLSEICEAERAGKLVVLPCKVGDTVYRILGERIVEMRVGNTYPSGLIIKGRLCNVYLVSGYVYACVTLSDFGKTVFLTPEAAREAMEGGNA